MVAKLDGGCLVAGLKEGEPVLSGSLRIWKHFGREAGAKAISLRVLELPAGEGATLRNEVADEVLYVIEGSGTAGGSAISIDNGIYLPAATSLDIVAGETLIIVSSQCPDVDGGGVAGGVAAGPAAVQPAGRRRHDGARVVAMRDRPVERTGDRWYRETINADDGSTQVTQFVGGIPPGRSTDHYHLYEEVIVILEGTGVMWAGTSNTPIDSGSCIFLPHGQVHCVENRGTGEMRLLGVFYPAGSPAVRYAAK